jgi:4-hydroxy 2-oxovalerate aldolase
MNKIRVLDCTLRDGGYINQWDFGYENIIQVVNSLNQAKIEIIEVGFLSNRVDKDVDKSKFTTIQDLSSVVSKCDGNALHVCMINYGEYNVEDLPTAKDFLIDGIRVAFHKKDLKSAVNFCKKVMDKGYKVFMQPMVAANYSDLEYLELIKYSNEIHPYAFYVVDSFGVMKENDVTKYFYLADYNLDKDIYIGFHSHNNLQLSYSNALSLLRVDTNRELIIDSSIFGMGRGAGNLNTELFIDYLNSMQKKEYKIYPLLEVIDYILKPIYHRKKWGYSLPHYLSAVNNCHPNYATYLDELNTLTVSDISFILQTLDSTQKNNFNKEYIKSRYIDYLENISKNRNDIEKIRGIFNDKMVLILAPGTSLKYYSDLVRQHQTDNVITLSVNFNSEKIKSDYVFFSNKRRFEKAILSNGEKIIATSNINVSESVDFVIDYELLLNNVSDVEDNAGLMLIKLLYLLDVKSVLLAGFDGYSHSKENEENYYKQNLSIVQTDDIIDRKNLGMNYFLNEFSKKINIKLITKPKHLHIF